MRKIAIVDDSEKIREKLKGYLERYSQTHDEQFQVCAFSIPEAFLTNYKPEYDIVLMDIDMPGMDGLKTSKRLRELDERVVLIFVTNLAQYAIRGYEVAATDFIVKPVSYDLFETKITRALHFVQEKTKPFLMLRTENGTAAVEVGDIQYVEVQGHYVSYHTAKDVYVVRGSLKQAVDEIGDPQFFVCDKSCIVNLAYVEGVSGNTITVGDARLSVSRPKKKAFMEALADFHTRD